MIRYTLRCANDHGFDSWFQSAEAFDRLTKRGLIECPDCGANQVGKSLMAPKVQGTKNSIAIIKTEAPQSTGTAREVALAELRRQVEENSEYVGMNFATEARAIHSGTAPERAIYGEARPKEARALIEDGVPVAPLPFAPKRKMI